MKNWEDTFCALIVSFLIYTSLYLSLLFTLVS